MVLKSFDFHSKIRDEHRITTSTGGAVSIISCVLILLLSASELYTFVMTPPKEVLTVDTERSLRLPIFFNITFPRLACAVISVDTSDVSGEEHQDIFESIYKVPIDGKGNVIGQPEVISNVDSVVVPPTHPEAIPENSTHEVPELSVGRKAPKVDAPDVHSPDYCGDCYGAGAEGECCNTCAQVREAYRKKGWLFFAGPNIIQCAQEAIREHLADIPDSGCQIVGQIQVAKVKGKLQFTPSKFNVHLHKLLHSSHGKVVDTSHHFSYLRFGSDLPNYKEASPLDGHSAHIEDTNTTATFRYHVNIVPTSYERSTGKVTNTNQYSVTQEALYMSEGHFHETPGVFVDYDISPIRVHVIENPRSLITFLTNLAAILGGIFTISAIFDALLFHGSKKLK